MAVPMGSAAKLVTFGGFNCCATSFRVAGVALCEIATGFVTCQKVLCDRRNTFARFSEDGLHFSWQAQHFGDLHRHFAWQAQHFRRVLLRVFATRIVRAATSGDNVQIAWQVWDIVRVYFTLCTPHPTFYTLHSALYTLHFTLYTSHFTLDIPQFTLQTLHFALHTRHFTLHTLHFTHHTPRFTLDTAHSTLYSLHSTLHALHFALFTSHFKFCTWHSTLYTLHSTLYTLHSTLYTLHSTLCTLHSTLYTLHSILHTPQSPLHTLHTIPHSTPCCLHTPNTDCTPLHSTLHSIHWYGNRGRMMTNVQDCWNNLFHESVLRDCISLCFDICTINNVWAFGFVGRILLFDPHVQNTRIVLVAPTSPKGSSDSSAYSPWTSQVHPSSDFRLLTTFQVAFCFYSDNHPGVFENGADPPIWCSFFIGDKNHVLNHQPSTLGFPCFSNIFRHQRHPLSPAPSGPQTANDSVKLADFGWANLLQEAEARRPFGGGIPHWGIIWWYS